MKQMKSSMTQATHGGIIIVARFPPDKPGQVMAAEEQL
jgi:hypothetical protein